MKLRGRDDIPAFPLDWFHENGGGILRAQFPPENEVFELFCTLNPAGRVFESEGTAVAVGIIGMGCAKSREMLLLPDFRAGKGEGTQSPAMKGIIK